MVLLPVLIISMILFSMCTPMLKITDSSSFSYVVVVFFHKCGNLTDIVGGPAKTQQFLVLHFP